MARIYGLNYDFISGGGTHLIFTPQADKRLAVIPHQVQMLTRNRIPGLLPFDCEDWNGSHRLCYDVTSRRNLFLTLRAMAPEQATVLEIAYRLVKIVADSAAYLMNEANYVLHEDFIYVADRLTEPQLCYLPVASVEKPPLAEELRMLVLRLLSCARTLEGDRIPRLLETLLTDSLRPDELKQMLKSLWLRPMPLRERPEERPAASARRAQNRKLRGLAAILPDLAAFRLAGLNRKGESAGGRPEQKPEFASPKVLGEIRAKAVDGKTKRLSAAGGRSDLRPQWRLRITKPDGAEVVEFAEDRFLIGRSKSGVHYTDSSEGISRIHCELIRSGDGLEVRDLGSLNGTLLNGEPLVPFKAYPFGFDDRIELMSTEIRLIDSGG